MIGFSSVQLKTIIVDTLILIFCLGGIYNFFYKPDLPFEINTQLVITNIEDTRSSLRIGDQLLTIENHQLKTKEEIEIFLDGRVIGEDIKLSILRSGKIVIGQITLSRFYTTIYGLIATFVGILFFIVAIIVFLKCDKTDIAVVFHWSFIFTGMIILMTWGNYTLLPFNLGLVTRTGFHIGYLFAPVFFLRFSILFPSNLNMKTKAVFKSLYIVGALLALALSLVFIVYSKNETLELMRVYILLFDISSVFIVLLVLSAISVFIHTYTTTTIETDRKKLRWIILGFIMGPLGYLVFWVIPSRIWNRPLLPEAIVLLLVAFVPITFGIAIIKYRLMNVDLIFKRSIVYATVISFLLIIYVAIISIAAKLINNQNSELSSIIAAISIALLFQPAKARVQKLVDKKFFRVEYDYRLALNLFNKKIKDVHNTKSLFEKVLDLICSLIPLSKIGYFSYDFDNNQIELNEQINYGGLAGRKIDIHQNNKSSKLTFPITTSNNIEAGAEITNTQFTNIEEINSALIFNIRSSKQGSHGFLVLGTKKSGANYTAEDIDLLNVISTRVGLTLDRIKLQEEIIREHLETERLQELNKLKSFFVSSVSHDLKTPLTSIKLFAERLRMSENISHEKKEEYFEIIEGESNRLTRLINNVLDYSKIERGTQKYNLQEIDIVETAKNVINSLEYQFKMNRFTLDLDYKQEKLFAFADIDAVSEALVNLLSNALKYSREIKHIEITIYKEHNHAVIEVKDSGEGISPEDLANIFDPFFRAKSEKIDKAGGAGLGLAIVKHIMDAHKGKIEVESSLGKGSKFSLLFPIGKSSDENINN